MVFVTVVDVVDYVVRCGVVLEFVMMLRMVLLNASFCFEQPVVLVIAD